MGETNKHQQQMEDLPLNDKQTTEVRGGAGQSAELNQLIAIGHLRPPPPKLPPDPPQPN